MACESLLTLAFSDCRGLVGKAEGGTSVCSDAPVRIVWTEALVDVAEGHAAAVLQPWKLSSRQRAALASLSGRTTCAESSGSRRA